MVTNQTQIDMRSLVSMRGKVAMPFVTVRWGTQVGQMTPDEVRQHALRLLEVASGAEMDALLVNFLISKGYQVKDAAVLLQTFRKARDDAEQTAKPPSP